MARGEHAGEDNEPREEIADRATQMPGQAELDAVGEEGALGMRREDVMVAPKGEGAVHAGVDEEVRGLDGFPASGPFTWLQNRVNLRMCSALAGTNSYGASLRSTMSRKR